MMTTSRVSRVDRITEIRDLIRSGQVGRSRRLIQELAKTRLSRGERVKLAYLAGQCGMYLRSLKLLHRQVRGKHAKLSPPTAEEKAEYAYALIDLGAIDEALTILESIDGSQFPRTYVFQGTIHFRTHDCGRIVPLMEQALKTPGLTDAEVLASKLRLAIALYYGDNGQTDFARGDQLVAEVLKTTSPERFRRVRYNAFLTRVHGLFLRKRWDEAKKAVDQMEELYNDDQGTLFQVYIEWWRCLLELVITNRSAAARARVEAFKRLATDNSFGELARQCDFLAAMHFKDHDLALKVCFLTPFEGIKNDLDREVGDVLSSLPETWDLPLAPLDPSQKLAPGQQPVVIEAATGANSIGFDRLKAGQIQQRLLQALVADGYIPPTTCSLFYSLYPDEFYNPASSPLKISQAVKRLRQWIASVNLPLAIVEHKGSYTLRSTGDRPVVIRLERSRAEIRATKSPQEAKIQDAINRLRKSHQEGWFRAADAQSTLDLSRSSILSLMQELGKSGSVESQGNGPARRYRLAQSQQRQSQRMQAAS